MARFVDKHIAENYLFMTLLQVLNMCFYILLYPYLIRVLGQEGFGLYAYATAVILLFITFVNYGFDLPAAKRIAQHVTDATVKEHVLSDVFTSKCLLEVLSAIAYVAIVFAIPTLRAHRLIYLIGFAQTLSFILFPIWYYQGIQRMRVVTYIQFGFKLLTIPGLLLWLHSSADVWILMLLNTLSSVLGALTAFLLIRFQDGLRIRFVALHRVRAALREASPFFLSNVTGIIKEQGIVLLTGSFLGLADVAIYDLANKIILIPRTLFSKVNDAMYPKMMVEGNKTTIRRVLRIEWLLGLGTIALIALLGPLAVDILGGGQMQGSYYVALILSITVLSWLVVGAMLQFCVIPSRETYWVTINQLQATVICLGVATLGAILWHNVYALSAGIAVAAVAEIVFCRIVIKHRRML